MQPAEPETRELGLPQALSQAPGSGEQKKQNYQEALRLFDQLEEVQGLLQAARRGNASLERRLERIRQAVLQQVPAEEAASERELHELMKSAY